MMRKAKVVFFVARDEQIQDTSCAINLRLLKPFASRFQARKAKKRMIHRWPDAYCLKSRLI
ncbi:hypothetical protein [Methyloversatilis sp.]|uniref:hypothetical protein n=1 Tax=Methyloversatilis sp. TaxID=2569862 RepID=UPI0027348585|nr:hypothetical protein [Methyloversatilis sp.]MDP2867735.1 hypothetical protein [Methyloversatilis sp.]MDP3455500.1 hypothetical protein [Methyloversatilis sp.]MDP3701296.1 hypothetical protein [Hylemonella sp.]